MNCRKCNLLHIIKLGFNAKGQQRYRCKDCKHIFTNQEKFKTFNQDEKSMMVKLSQEGLSLRAIGRTLNRTTYKSIAYQLKKN